VRWSDGDKRAPSTPYEGFKVNFSIDFDHPAFHALNRSEMVIFDHLLRAELSRARTFGFLRDIEKLRRQQSGPRRQSGQCRGGR
jgi:UDP-3-O-[3-hydroxymyristoyl] N-acetylglucosamine deacetylase